MSSRARRIAEKVRRWFPQADLVDQRIARGRNVAVVRLRFRVGSGALIDIREVWRGEELVDYGYQLTIAEYRGGEGAVAYTNILRYNSAPHHPELPTFPHHRHVEGRVEPLENPSLEKFLEEARQILERLGKRC